MILLHRPIDVVCYKEVQLAVVVIIEPHRAGGESRIADACPGCDISELAAAQIAKEMIWPDAGYVNIFIPIIVVVGDRDSDAIHFDGQARLSRDIRERAVLIVVVQREKRFAGLVFGPVHGIDEQNVLPAVIVIVKKSAARAEGFRQILFSKGAAVMFEMYPGLR